MKRDSYDRARKVYVTNEFRFIPIFLLLNDDVRWVVAFALNGSRKTELLATKARVKKGRECLWLQFSWCIDVLCIQSKAKNNMVVHI
jgi:hypothetical protein